MATALFVAGAVLARASAEEARGTSERESDRARLAFKDFRRALLDEERPHRFKLVALLESMCQTRLP